MICGKIIFNSQTEAAQAVRGSNRDGRKTKKRKIKETYYCDDCKGWHTSSGGKKRKYKKKIIPMEMNGMIHVKRYNRLHGKKFLHFKDFNKTK